MARSLNWRTLTKVLAKKDWYDFRQREECYCWSRAPHTRSRSALTHEQNSDHPSRRQQTRPQRNLVLMECGCEGISLTLVATEHLLTRLIIGGSFIMRFYREIFILPHSPSRNYRVKNILATCLSTQGNRQTRIKRLVMKTVWEPFSLYWPVSGGALFVQMFSSSKPNQRNNT